MQPKYPVMKNYLVLASVFLFINCASIQIYEKENHIEIVDELAIEALGEEYATRENDRGSHFLVFKESTNLNDLMGVVAFFIYDKSSQNIIFQDELEAGSVSWASDVEIIAIARNRHKVMQVGEPLIKTYYYDVLEKRKKEDKLVMK